MSLLLASSLQLVAKKVISTVNISRTPQRNWMEVPPEWLDSSLSNVSKLNLWPDDSGKNTLLCLGDK